VVWEQADALKHVSDAPTQLVGIEFGDVASVDPDFPPTRLFQAVDHLERRGLAAAGGADQHQGLAPFDVERDSVHRRYAARVDLAHRTQRDHGGIVA